MFMPTLGEMLKKRAEELDLSDAEVARRLDVSARRYNNYANGKRTPAPDMILKICAVLKTSPNELFCFDDDFLLDARGEPVDPGRYRAVSIAAQMPPETQALWFSVGNSMLESSGLQEKLPLPETSDKKTEWIALKG